MSAAIFGGNRGRAAHQLISSCAVLAAILVIAVFGGAGLHLLFAKNRADPQLGPAGPRIMLTAHGVANLRAGGNSYTPDPDLDEEVLRAAHHGHECLSVGDWILALHHQPTEMMRKPDLLEDCRLGSGRWISPLDARWFDHRATIIGAPVVPIALAQQSGLPDDAVPLWLTPHREIHWLWMPVSIRTFRQRSGRSIEAWEPPTPQARCWYGQRWLTIKLQFKLTVTQEERRALHRLLDDCAP
ncbi:MAG: hypothetical protein OXE84_13345 [Rhodobacteraceae bacterium]|nr:hypothetical protein [Paracoccaceae bacterium]MCY4198056.1 hypothetical protein [Paracoccaceae bacterium]